MRDYLKKSSTWYQIQKNFLRKYRSHLMLSRRSKETKRNLNITRLDFKNSEMSSNYYNIQHMNIENNFEASWIQINQENQRSLQQLQSMKLSQVFLEVKDLVNSIFGRRVLTQKSQQSRKKLKLIFEFVLRKLRSRILLDTKKFVGLMSLLSFILVSTKEQTNSLNFPNHFYRNIIKYTQNIASVCLKKQGPETDEEKRKILSAYLFSLCTFCEGGQKLVGLNLKKFFSLSLMKTLLKLRFIDDERVMRHYRILVLYITENKPKVLSNSLIFQSLAYHLTTCSSNKGTQSIIIFLLNKVLRNEKLAKKISSCFDLSNVTNKIKEIMSRGTTNLHLHKLTFSLLSKIIEMDKNLSQNLMNASEIITIISQFHIQINNDKRINSSILAILDKMPAQDSFEVYKAFTDSNKFDSNSLRITEILTQRSNPYILMDMINKGFIPAIIRYSRSKNAPQYHQYLVTRIIENVMIMSEDINKEISQILKVLIFSQR